jgi:WD40 repeat protein
MIVPCSRIPRSSPSGRMRAFCPLVAALLLALIASGRAAEKLRDLRGVSRASFNHDASRVVVHDDTSVMIWELPAGTPVASDLDPKAESDGFLMSADGKLVAIGFKDGRCRVFDSTTAKAISPPLDFRLNAAFQMPGLFSPDGNTLLLFGDKDAVAIEIQTGKKIATIPLAGALSEEATSSAAFADAGAQCFIMNGAGVVTRYDTKNWKPARTTMRHLAAESAYDFGFTASEDGKWLVTYDSPGENGPKGNLQAWDAMTGKALGKPIVAVNGMAGRFVGNNRILVLPGRGDATVRDLPSMNVA